MSKEHAKKFIEHIQKDDALRKRINDASDHILKVAKEHGYDISRADLRHALKENWSQQSEEADEASFPFSEAPGF